MTILSFTIGQKLWNHTFLRPPKSKVNRFGIQQYCVIKYKPCGTIAVSKSYSEVYEPFKYLKQLPEEISLSHAPAVSLKAGKIKDVKDLYMYLEPESKNFYEEFFAATGETNGEGEPDEGDNEEVLFDDSNFDESADELQNMDIS